MNARARMAPQAAESAEGGTRPAPVSLGALANLVGFHLARAAVTTNDAFERLIDKPFNLNKVEFSLLMLLQANSAIPPKRLARALVVTAPKLTLLLDRLQGRGLIKRERNPLDGRSQHVVLTDKGRRLARDATAAVASMERVLLERLTAAEHAMLIELLGKLAAQKLP
jgi:DNA-binding MarR family transcriptional regulator